MRRRDFLGVCPLAALAASARRLTVMSYNIHHGEGLDGRFDVPRIAAVIRACRPDLVALQEVDRGTARSSGVDQLLTLGELTRMAPFFCKTLDYRGGAYGNAILSTLPIMEQRTEPLPGAEPRGLLSIRIEAGFWFHSTHLDVSREESHRIASAVRINSECTGPAILAGDLNCVRTSPPLAKLSEQWTIAGEEVPTMPSDDPKHQIDFILYRPATRWRVVSVSVREERLASDHRPITAVLEQL